MAKIGRICDECGQFGEVPVNGPTPLLCPHCSAKWGEVTDPKAVFDQCPCCPARQFYIMKDFNQFVGCTIMLIGIALVPFTYGLSLPVFALIDWLIFRKVGSFVVCYRCSSEFRDFEIPKRLKPFLHHIGLKYDKYRK